MLLRCRMLSKELRKTSVLEYLKDNVVLKRTLRLERPYPDERGVHLAKGTERNQIQTSSGKA